MITRFLRGTHLQDKCTKMSRNTHQLLSISITYSKLGFLSVCGFTNGVQIGNLRWMSLCSPHLLHGEGEVPCVKSQHHGGLQAVNHPRV